MTKDGDVEVLTSNNTGSSTDWAITVAVNDTAGFSPPSFAVTTKGLVGGTSSSTSNGVLYSYKVPAGGYAPNGNLLVISDAVMGDWYYSYDALDRLSTATVDANVPVQYAGMSGCWTYDAFGNRLTESMSTTACTNSPTPQSWSLYSAANNQMTTTSMTTGQAKPTTSGATEVYDASGNVLSDGYNKYWYDAEGRICASQVAGGGNAWQYVYDAEGARIAAGMLTATPASGSTCTPYATNTNFTLTNQYAVDLANNQVTEYNTSALNVGSNGLGWVHSNVWVGGKLIANYDDYGPALHFFLEDPLGTKRVTANILGNWDETCTSLPFGNDVGNPLPVNEVYPEDPFSMNCTGNEGATPNTFSDATEHRFSQKEYDPMTGNDYFEARYYSPEFGRFLSPDWSVKVEPVPYAVLTDPQSLNLYAYVRNNPLTRIDADGHDALTLAAVWGGIQTGATAVETGLVAGASATAAAVVSIGAEIFAPAMAGSPAEIHWELHHNDVPAPANTGNPHAPGDVPNDQVVVKGGTKPPPPGSGPYSGSQGSTVEEAGKGVPHNQVQPTTGGQIREAGGDVRPAPEAAHQGGPINGQHVNVTGGQSAFGPPQPNPVPQAQRVPGGNTLPSPPKPTGGSN